MDSNRPSFVELRVRQLSAGSILKLCLFVIPLSLVAGLLFGLFALWGFDTVRWGSDAVVGLDGLLLGLALGLAMGLGVAFANFLAIWVGMSVVSTFKTTKLAFIEP